MDESEHDKELDVAIERVTSDFRQICDLWHEQQELVDHHADSKDREHASSISNTAESTATSKSAQFSRQSSGVSMLSTEGEEILQEVNDEADAITQLLNDIRKAREQHTEGEDIGLEDDFVPVRKQRLIRHRILMAQIKVVQVKLAKCVCVSIHAEGM